MNSFEKIFKDIKTYCLKKQKISEIGIKTWLDPLIPISFKDSNAIFKIETNFQKNIIITNYASILSDAFFNLLSLKVNIIINVENDEINTKISTNDDKFLNKYDYTFNTFIEGSSNNFALACSKSIVKKCRKKLRSNDYNPLFIYGTSGIGKTHLLNAIANGVYKNYPEINVVNVTSKAFENEFITAIKTNLITNFRVKYHNADLFLIDDIQFLIGKEFIQKEFLQIFYKLYQESRQIVITSNKSPKDFFFLDNRIKTYLDRGIIANISEPDYETRLAIIKSKLLYMKIPIEVLEFMVNHIKFDMHQLEKTIVRLKDYLNNTSTQITIPMVQNVIRSITTDNSMSVLITVEKIIAYVSSIYGISPNDIRSNKRTQQISIARKIAIYIVRKITKMSLTSIGAEFGGRDHSTIVYSINSVTEAIRNDLTLSHLVNNIIDNISNNKSKSKI